MALDRQRFGERRIHEIHTLVISVDGDQLQTRYQRDFDKCIEIGCEITSSNINSATGARLSLRVPPDRLAEYLRFFATGAGKIESHSVNAEDKSIEFVDTAARLETLEALRTRLRTLLESAKAQSVEDILKVEKELARVQGEIDTTAARKRFLEKITGNATVNVDYTVPAAGSKPDYQGLRNSFRDGWQGFIASLAIAITTIGILLPWAIFILTGVLVGRAIYRMNERRNAANSKKPAAKGDGSTA